VIWEPQKIEALVMSLPAAPQKGSNKTFTYRHSNCIRPVLPAPRECGCVSRVDSFVKHSSE